MRIALAQTEIFSKQYEKNKKTALSITGNGSAAAAVSGDELHRLQYGYGLQHCRWSGYRPLDAEVGNHWAMLSWIWLGQGYQKRKSRKPLQHCCSGRFTFLRYGETAPLFLRTRRPIF